ncbi:MAG: phenylalanine 4-monooxygenase [Planctomycetota bacterium]|nr:phenylalanine 4-monooxygenase [Planctomycetota bacterium]
MHHDHRRASEDQRDLVWRTLVERQIGAVRSGMAREFLEGLERSALDPARMPRHASLSRKLEDLCGWRIETVPGLIPARDFFALLRDRRFPSPDWIRHPDDLEYTPEPDAFHDLFGHVPQLASSPYSDVLGRLADAARDASDAELAEVERVYWFTIEFGLVQEGAAVRALGAGLASSIAELERALRSPGVRRRPFLIQEARHQGFQTDQPQELYLVAPGLAALAASLAGLGPASQRRAG